MPDLTLKDYIPHIQQTEQMLDYMLGNVDNLVNPSDELRTKLQFVAVMQSAQKKLDAIEKRMREEIATFYDCDLGKSKTKTDKELGFKVEVSRGLDIKLNKEIPVNHLFEMLGEYADSIFPAKREFSKTGFNAAPEHFQEEAQKLVITKPASLSLKVTKL